MDNKDFYEKFDWVKANLAHKLQGKIERLINEIPSDVKSIIDIGCGDGAISNKLHSKFNVVAVDRGFQPLKFVNSNAVQASADLLSFRDNSFDMVFSSETIEHLPDDIFIKSISEFKRISKKYIFLTFPNNENIEKQLTQCPKCNFIFNKSYHLRSLNSEIIKNHFPEYKIISEFEIGTMIRQYNKLLSKIKHKYSPSISWIPYYWTKNDNALRTTLCANCSHSFRIEYKFHPIASACDMLNIFVSKKNPYQLCILLEKK
ncbi:MAG: methyltransferase domain-containing protein [Ignavibacteriae bacterium]|nr:methyltransferase domain-containing protein [Ignavibacteriota bacterium]